MPKRKAIWLVAIIAFALLAVIAKSRWLIDFDNLSESQLVEAGYYAYILPSEMQADFNYHRIIRMHGFDWHCNPGSRDDNWNPVEIRYTNLDQVHVFDIRISPNDAIFDKGVAKAISLNFAGSNTHMAQYYIENGGTNIEFYDRYGMDVVFASPLSLDSVKELISDLIFIGDTNVTNPWQAACQP
jgi:hypothetical protein